MSQYTNKDEWCYALEQQLAEKDRLLKEAQAKLDKINTPELIDFREAVMLEAQHQRLRWSADHDAGKQPQDWFWLIGYLSGKALRSHIDGDTDKALHHTITVAAACANWHAAVLGLTDIRPGIDPVAKRIEAAKERGE